MINHLAKLKRTTRFAHWRLLPSQALQNVIERIDFGYQKFFDRDNKRPPQFRSKLKYKSYTLKQAGYKFLERNKVRIGKCVFRYHKSRKFDVDSVKTVTIKRDRVGDLWLCVVAKAERFELNIAKTGKTAGFDFGLKTYLTASDSTRTQSPLFFNRNSRKVKKSNRNISRKKKGSNNMYFETLNIDAMKALWGRKISDLGFSDFLNILKYVAKKTGKVVKQIDQWLPTSKTCSACGTVKEDLELRERTFHCCECGLEIGRDLNAAINIHRWGRPPMAEVA